MESHLSVVILNIIRRFRQMFHERGPDVISVAVKSNQSLRQPGIVETLFGQQVAHHQIAAPLFNQGFNIQAVGGYQPMQIPGKSKLAAIFLHPQDIVIFGVVNEIVEGHGLGTRLEIFMVAGKQGLEHPGGRPGSRHEFHRPAGLGRRSIEIHQSVHLFFFKTDNAVTDGAGSIQVYRRDAVHKHLQLGQHFSFAQTMFLDLLSIGSGKNIRAEHFQLQLYFSVCESKIRLWA